MPRVFPPVSSPSIQQRLTVRLAHGRWSALHDRTDGPGGITARVTGGRHGPNSIQYIHGAAEADYADKSVVVRLNDQLEAGHNDELGRHSLRHGREAERGRQKPRYMWRKLQGVRTGRLVREEHGEGSVPLELAMAGELNWGALRSINTQGVGVTDTVTSRGRNIRREVLILSKYSLPVAQHSPPGGPRSDSAVALRVVRTGTSGGGSVLREAEGGIDCRGRIIRHKLDWNKKYATFSLCFSFCCPQSSGRRPSPVIVLDKPTRRTLMHCSEAPPRRSSSPEPTGDKDSNEARPRIRATRGEVDAALRASKVPVPSDAAAQQQSAGRTRSNQRCPRARVKRWRRQNGISAREDPKCRAAADGPRAECGRSSPPHSAERLALLRRKTAVRALRVRRLRAARGSSSAWSSGGVRRLREACEARRMGTTHDGSFSSLRAAFRRDETRNTEVGGTCVRSRRGDEKSRIGGTSRGGGDAGAASSSQGTRGAAVRECGDWSGAGGQTARTAVLSVGRGVAKTRVARRASGNIAKRRARWTRRAGLRRFPAYGASSPCARGSAVVPR
ncbi:hypothetical protein DFH09DRAFT_1088588 [Mycena vulgaris]|nr:hypothetical protein DFH09DRAFT_1088588 [Mycena vulgaris]